jgi:hypothetical protein
MDFRQIWLVKTQAAWQAVKVFARRRWLKYGRPATRSFFLRPEEADNERVFCLIPDLTQFIYIGTSLGQIAYL